jgi:hypothetical protein
MMWRVLDDVVGAVITAGVVLVAAFGALCALDALGRYLYRKRRVASQRAFYAAIQHEYERRQALERACHYRSKASTN